MSAFSSAPQRAGLAAIAGLAGVATVAGLVGACSFTQDFTDPTLSTSAPDASSGPASLSRVARQHPPTRSTRRCEARTTKGRRPHLVPNDSNARTVAGPFFQLGDARALGVGVTVTAL